MATTFSYRPKAFTVPELLKIAKRKGTNLNRMIEEALTKEILEEKAGSEAEELTQKIGRVVVEHMGFRLVKPDQKTHERIVAKMKETNRKGTWVRDEEVRPDAYKK